MKMTPDSLRPWWLLARDVLLFGLGAGIWINEIFLKPGAIELEALAAGAAAMALPVGIRQDAKKS